MSNLEDAAHAAVLAVRALRQRLDEAQEACGRSRERVTKLGDTLDADREALDQAVPELDKVVEERSQQLSDGTGTAETALAEVAQAIKAASSDGHHALEHEAAAGNALAEHLQLLGTQVDILAQAAVGACQAAVGHAGSFTHALHEAAETLAGHLSTFGSFADEMGREVENAALAAKSVLPDQYVPVLAAADQEFESKAGEIPVALKALFADMEKHAQEVAEYSLGQFRLLVEAERTAIQERVQSLAIEMEELTRQANQEARDIEAAGGTLVQDLRSNVEAAGRVTQALHHVRGRWVLFGFGI